MSNISQVVVKLSSDDRAILKDAGLNEETFVRGSFAQAIDKLAKPAKKEKAEPKAEASKSEGKFDAKKPEASDSKPSGK